MRKSRRQEKIHISPSLNTDTRLVREWVPLQCSCWWADGQKHNQPSFLSLSGQLSSPRSIRSFSLRRNNKSLHTKGGPRIWKRLEVEIRYDLCRLEIRVKKLWKQSLKGVLELGPSRCLPKMEPNIVEIAVTWGKQRPARVQHLA